MAKKQFKAESKRLLDLMVNSIYTHKEIFLRELISNASDAMDKRYYNALSAGESGLDRAGLTIDLAVDAAGRTLSVADHGCGMTDRELESNLGTIARSGSLAFKQQNAAAEGTEIIGQFGVGFYSAFMVAQEVEVFSRAAGQEEGWRWHSSGADGYTLEPCPLEEAGTRVVLHLKENTPEENYDEFLDPYRLQALVRKYSDYIRYPIRLEMPVRQPKEGAEGEFETVQQLQTLNSMTPLWRRSPAELKPEDYAQFYKEKFFDFEDPARVIHFSGEGAVSYQALLFIPAHAPFNYYSKEYEKGLQLYANGVLIMDHCADLLPDCFGFVRGLVDSPDLSLNISREMLQHDRQLKTIASRLEKKIKAELSALLAGERPAYEAFYKQFGLQLKYGVYEQFGARKELLQDLLLFPSSRGEGLTTLAEYCSRMPDGQAAIYYAAGQSPQRLAAQPQTRRVLEKGFEVLFLTEDIDEFVLRTLESYQEKLFRPVGGADPALESAEDKNKLEEKEKEYAQLMDFCSKTLSPRVEKVRLAAQLQDYPACLNTEGDLSLEMERVLAAMPGEYKPKARRVLELNPFHPAFGKLAALYADDQRQAAACLRLLYDQALLLEGMLPDDPAAHCRAVAALLAGQELPAEEAAAPGADAPQAQEAPGDAGSTPGGEESGRP